ncbi:acrylyl-CoA reductase family protein [Larsenimonas suaedae]|uniref:Acryloyl-CoA reductase n=1 Tax=Larsenimonas suaedae TaxID=1851019 RepID=A0ABU1GSR9_9GAMM|nr:acryloyl-CoA reductase [Larsenimonas suaedae]MCM2972175.1 acryloyl-CoA reductase [Larsenimonas suaedae]MDR5895029.1 acryloyl-CoA reductase [Larsenimonas suaedae]
MAHAVRVFETEPRVRLEHMDDPVPGQGQVVVDIEYSALNYKDALALTGRGKIIRAYPLTPGVDAAGVVADSRDERYRAGDRVIMTGWGVGERTDGGFTTRQCFDADTLVLCPDNLAAKDAMIAGTAGLTAMLALMKLETLQQSPAAGPLLVTGATGGVGQWAVTLLSAAGFEVHALTGKPDQAEHLKTLGAHEIVDRHAFTENVRPLDKACYAGGVDTVGSAVLAALLSRTFDYGNVAAVGLAGGMDLHTSVAPFILRGVSLLGIESVRAPFEQRQEAWQRLAGLGAGATAPLLSGVIGFESLETTARSMIDGTTAGRYLVDPAK